MFSVVAVPCLISLGINSTRVVPLGEDFGSVYLVCTHVKISPPFTGCHLDLVMSGCTVAGAICATAAAAYSSFLLPRHADVCTHALFLFLWPGAEVLDTSIKAPVIGYTWLWGWDSLSSKCSSYELIV